MTFDDVPRDASSSTRAEQVAALTGLRGFAALMVVVVHVSSLTEYQWLGLPLYGPVSLFVLSGYLLYRPWARWGLQRAKRPSVTVFARRRLARIFPAYLLVLGMVLVIYPPSRPATTGGWLRTVTLTWIYDDQELPPTFIQTWSLATELSWYLALPAIAIFTGAVTRGRTPRAGFWLRTAVISLALPTAVAWRWWVSADTVENYVPYALWLPGFLPCFALGALLVHFVEGERAGLVSLHVVRGWAADHWAVCVFTAAVALLGTSSLGGPPGFSDTFAQEQLRVLCATGVAIALLALVVLGDDRSPVHRVLSTTWFTAVGRWSYGIFLWHLPLIVILEADLGYPSGPPGLAYRLLLILGLSIPLGAATYAWVERPAIRWSHGRVVPAPPGSAPPTDTR